MTLSRGYYSDILVTQYWKKKEGNICYEGIGNGFSNPINMYEIDAFLMRVFDCRIGIEFI